MTNKPLRIGAIGLDTSHVVKFAEMLNDPKSEHRVQGGQLVAAYPGGTKDFELSWSRVDQYTETLRDQYNITMMDSPQAVAEACDLLLITSVDGRVHLDQFQQTLPYKRPTFIDKPFATSLHDAHEIFRLANEVGIPIMSSSSWRYEPILTDALQENSDPIIGCDTFGRMPLQPTQPGLFWYGIHQVEMLVRVMGLGCRQVRSVCNDDFELITFEYEDGRLASMRGNHNTPNAFGVTIYREEGARQVDLSSSGPTRHKVLLNAALKSLAAGQPDVPQEETLEVIRMIEAANASRSSGGDAVKLAPLSMACSQ